MPLLLLVRHPMLFRDALVPFGYPRELNSSGLLQQHPWFNRDGVPVDKLTTSAIQSFNHTFQKAHNRAPDVRSLTYKAIALTPFIHRRCATTWRLGRGTPLSWIGSFRLSTGMLDMSILFIYFY